MGSIEEYIKKCTDLGFEKPKIVQALKDYGLPETQIEESFKKIEEQKHESKRKLKIGVISSILMLFVFIGLLYPSFIGYVVNENISVHSENIIFNISENKSISWSKQNEGVLNSLLASGEIFGNGSVKIYLVSNGTRYKLVDSNMIEKKKGGGLLTGLVIDETLTATTDQIQDTQNTVDESQTQVENLPTETTNTQTESQTIVEETPLDNLPTQVNDTQVEQQVELTTELINTTDQIVITENISNQNDVLTENISLSDKTEEIVDTNNTLNEIETNIQTDNNVEINNIIENIPITNISEENLLNISTELNDSIIENNLTIETQINNSIIENITTIKDSYTFEDICVETCFLPKINSNDYKLEIEIDNGTTLIITKLRYETSLVNIVNETLNITTNLTSNQTINETLNITSNITINQSLNETNAINTTDFVLNNATINGTVEINKPVRWKKFIDLNLTKEIILPKEAFNISSKDDRVKIIFKNQSLSVNEFNLEKEKDILINDILRLEKSQKVTSSKLFRKTINNNNEINSINRKLKQIEKQTKNISIDSNITLTFIDNNTSNISNAELEFYTEGPKVDENITSNNQKLITISSDLHYENIKAYTDIPESRQEMVSLVWLTDIGRLQVTNINYVDTNNNGLIDRIEWIVPHLSNQTYEVTINVLNLHSYPMVGGEWKVEFITTGKDNLIITAENGTVYGRDIAPVKLMCGDVTLNPVITSTSIIYNDYECNSTGYFIAKELRQGPHTQKFMFGNATAYAYNFAGNLPKTINLHGKLTNSTGGVINTTVNMTFSLYTTSSGGSADWTETQNSVNISEGIYSVILGSVTPITVNFSVPYWLGIKVNTDAEMTPRINMTNTPYTYNAYYAQEALDLVCTDCIGNSEINTTGVFNIDGNLNATNNITLGNSILGSDNQPRITITDTGVIINLE